MTVVILSDVHFGSTDCGLSEPAAVAGLVRFLRKEAQHIHRLVLLGDIVDLNVAKLADAAPQLRRLLESISSAVRVDRTVYVPGNHDFLVWHQIAGSQSLAQLDAPTEASFWRGKFDQDRIRLLLPDWLRTRVTLDYPLHRFRFGTACCWASHGHLVDTKQTGGCLPWETEFRTFMDKTQGWQMFAGSAPYYAPVGAPATVIARLANLWSRATKTASLPKRQLDISGKFVGWLARTQFKQSFPDIYVYGHTHRSGYGHINVGRTKAGGPRMLHVVNAGSFVRSGAIAGCFLLGRTAAAKNHPKFELVSVDLSGDCSVGWSEPRIAHPVIHWYRRDVDPSDQTYAFAFDAHEIGAYVQAEYPQYAWKQLQQALDLPQGVACGSDGEVYEELGTVEALFLMLQQAGGLRGAIDRTFLERVQGRRFEFSPYLVILHPLTKRGVLRGHDRLGKQRTVGYKGYFTLGRVDPHDVAGTLKLHRWRDVPFPQVP